MRVVVITRHGGPEVLKVEERPSPRCGAGRVRIEVAAAGVNFADTLARVGLYEDAPDPPCVVGYEVAGTVAEVGDGVTAVAACSVVRGTRAVVVVAAIPNGAHRALVRQRGGDVRA